MQSLFWTNNDKNAAYHTEKVGMRLFDFLVMMRERYLRQYRTKIVPQMRCQIFRQIVQKFRRHTDVCRGIFVQDDGKYASRCGAKPQGGLCAVLP